MHSPAGAILSDCGRYRYALWRRWEPRRPDLLVVGLNPSTADATQDDPTIRRCVGFARQWGYGGLLVANLFAYRTPHPRQLKQAAEPIGPQNDQWIGQLASRAALVLVAWGNHGSYLGRDRAVLARLPDPHCLTVTRQGQPGHPLYLPAASQPVPFPGLP